MPIPPGALACFYTDGLVERPGEPIDDGLARLCRVVRPEPAEAACRHGEHALVGADPARDDIALLVLWRTAARPSSASPQRRPPDDI